MDYPNEEEIDSDASTVLFDTENPYGMDIEDDDLTPDLIDLQENNVPPVGGELSPISLIANVGSPSVSTVSENTMDSVPNIDVPTDNINNSRISSRRSTQDEDDGMTCPICLDSWTNLGEHRICALKCGHLFGLSCISRWITTLKNKVCPTCKEKATKHDFRLIYANKLVPVDEKVVEEIRQKLVETVKERTRLQIELTKSVCREHLLVNKIRELKNNVSFLTSSLEEYHPLEKSIVSNLKVYREKSLELCKAKGCRVLSYNVKNNLIIASTKSPNILFPGFGARTIDLSTFKPTSYIPLHSSSIRDMRFHSEQPWLLSVSLDKTFKIVDTNSNLPITTQNSNDIPLWSCCWDTNDANAFFVGQQQGSTVKFDIRQPNQAVDTYAVPCDNSPVVSVASITAGSNIPLEDGGIISCKLNSLWVFSNKASDECSRHFLPIDPPFICATYDNTKSQMLVSTRPNSAVSHIRHRIANLELQDANNLIVNVSYCLTGSTTSKFLSRSCLLSHQGCGYAAAYQESDNMVYIWSTETGQKVGKVPAHNAVLDLCSVSVANSTYLFSLTESKIDFYKMQ